SAISISLATETRGATILYTTDGSNPDYTSPVFTEPFTLPQTTTVKSVALKSGMNASPVISKQFIINPNAPSTTAHRGWNGQCEVRINGQVGQTFVIEASTDLTNWAEISTVTLTAPVYFYMDPNAASFTSRFYRARPSP
ncbi:MAG: chitobiase/beta-hexosaminidase C-terminal domain-containing protein, partial [Verrucomicrobiota bacterium]|nr:chitobiase/beta-hexosaminidase C-terminal domain-containing protein [Verrucomicrobiota bacterium]